METIVVITMVIPVVVLLGVAAYELKDATWPYKITFGCIAYYAIVLIIALIHKTL